MTAADTTPDLDRIIVDFMGEFSKIHAPERYNRLGNEFIRKFVPERALEIASALAFANPFFLPDIPDGSVANLRISQQQFGDMTLRAKLTARHSRHLNVLVACAPKSASTFIQRALEVALGLPVASLFTASDELSLIRNGLNGKGYVGQLHMRCSPYAARLLNLYNILPIVTIRNIFDTLVSLDDMLLEWRQSNPGNEHFLTMPCPSIIQAWISMTG